MSDARTGHRRHRRRATAALAAFAMVATLVGATGAGAATTDPWASRQHWDPRLADLAKQVEKLRGLQFDHAVPVKVLTTGAFDRRFQRGHEPTAHDRADWKKAEGTLRAVGLLEHDIPLEELSSGLGAQVLGFYDPRTQSIVVRGDTLSSAPTRATLAHEMTHALQDQHFSLGALRQAAAKHDNEAVTALVEGDASRIGQEYTEGLSKSDQAAVASFTRSTGAGGPDLPPVLSVVLGARYELGLLMATTLAAKSGNRSVDHAFRNPPANDLTMIDPSALLGGDTSKRVATPELAKGDKAADTPGTLGALELYLILASQLPPADALHVAQRWGGDSSVPFTRGSTPCVVTDLVGRGGATDASTLADGLRRWAAAARNGAEVSERAGTVRFSTCAPATSPPVSEAALNRALGYVVIRNELVSGFVRDAPSVQAAQCFADGVMDLAPIEKLVDSTQSPDRALSADDETAITDALRANATRLRSQCNVA